MFYCVRYLLSIHLDRSLPSAESPLMTCPAAGCLVPLQAARDPGASHHPETYIYYRFWTFISTSVLEV